MDMFGGRHYSTYHRVRVRFIVKVRFKVKMWVMTRLRMRVPIMAKVNVSVKCDFRGRFKVMMGLG